MNEDGQCGVGHELPILAPTRIEFQDQNDGPERYVISVSCGHSHTVCILSNYLPQDATYLISRLQKYPSSAQIIGNFARYSLFRLRLSRYLHNKQKGTPAAQIVVEQTQTKESPEKKEQLDDSSSLSSHSSWSDDPYPLDETQEKTTNNNELSQRLIEMQKMSDEDQRSSAYMAHLRALRERANAAEKIALEKNRMKEEDILARKLRAHSKSTNNVGRRKTKQKSKAAVARDVRASDQILKAAQRLKLARERREQQSNAKRTLPPAPVHRQPLKRNQHTNKKCPPLHDIANNEQKSAAELARGRRRRKLVRQRESRLAAQEEAKNEADRLRQRNLKVQHEMDRLTHAETVLKLEKERKKVEDARKLELAMKAAELRRLEDELKVNKSLKQLKSENKENEANRGSFHDLKHWTKSLSGVT
mmetsp:Transcript_10021/g.21139  ORF Transcript_10021/g.21139 Transcript_10021/m.21139 type:complete len:419 (-) Transcript_10021:451-1707(-)